MFDDKTFLKFSFDCVINLMFGGVIFTGCFYISKIVLSYYLNKNNKLLYDKEEVIPPKEIYTHKYWTEYYALENKNIQEDICKNNSVIDELPFYGKTMIKYDDNLKGFYYYNNRGSHIPYDMLETLARKYVVTYNCKLLYVNIHHEVITKHMLNMCNKGIVKDDNKNSSVFIGKNKFKKTNMGKNNLIKNNFIKFKYKGPIKESNNDLSSEKYNNSKKNIDYSTFKMLNKEKDE
jgi:hypothetical protein|tara:strand:+ start:995 stop:1696 length:702 start_codon:yes stop_codon:yes gene_type:complete